MDGSALNKFVCERISSVLLALLLCVHAALASDPLPGDAVAPPANVNIVLYYNIFTDAGKIEPVRGDGYGHGTHVSLNIEALRYIRTFDIGGMLSGVQVVQPYTAFVGTQTLGIRGVGRYPLSHSDGFTQPSLGAFIFPICNPATAANLVAGFWFAPPTGRYDQYDNISLTQNLWIGELETGGHVTLLGDAAGRNVALEVWGEGYFFASNGNATLAGLGGTAPARLSEQPSGEIRLYLPVQLYGPSRALVVPGFFQSFGGKQVYTLGSGAKLDAGTRTQESQLRFVLSSYLSPHWQILLDSQYDLAAHGAALNRQLELRVAAIF